jgi:hypothetical protein
MHTMGRGELSWKMQSSTKTEHSFWSLLPTISVSEQQTERQPPEICVTMRDSDAHQHAGPESELPTEEQGCTVRCRGLRRSKQ